MTASQLLDIVNITTPKIAEPSKSYKGDSSAFENVLNDVNKSYAEDDKKASVNSDNTNKQSSQTTEKEPVSEDKITNQNETTQNKPEEKVSEKDSSTSDSSTSEKDSDENESEIPQENNIENKENNEAPKKIEIVETQKPNIENIKNQNILEPQTEQVKEVETEIINNEAVSEVKPEGQDTIPETQELPEPQMPENNNSSNKQNASSSIEDILITVPDNTPIITVLSADTNIVSKPETTTNQENIVINNLTQNNSQIKDLNENIQNNISNQNTVPEPVQSSSDLQTNSDAIKTENSEIIPQQTATSQSPTIQAETETMVADVNTKTNQENANILEKTNLTQETLDEMDAKITSIESSSSSNTDTNENSSLNKQNVQDQTVKLEIENSTTEVDTSNVDLPDTTDMGISNNLGKSLTAQTTTVNQTQMSAFTHTTKDINQADITSQINNQLKTKSFQEEGLTKITIVLKPENLGKINLELVTSKEGLTAQMTTDNPQVKEFLDKNLDNLKDSLGNQGVNVSNVTVKVENTQKQSNDMNAFEQQLSQNNQQSSDNTKNANKNDFEFEKEVDELANSNTSENIENEKTSEDESIISHHAGQIDYKV